MTTYTSRVCFSRVVSAFRPRARLERRRLSGRCTGVATPAMRRTASEWPAHAAAPEGIVLSLRQDAGGVQAVQRKPCPGSQPQGNNAHLAGFLRRRVHAGEMLRNAGHGVKAVDHVEQGRVFGVCSGRSVALPPQAPARRSRPSCLLPHPRSTFAPASAIRRACGSRREHRFQLHIRILANRGLHTAAQIAIPQNTDTNGHSSEVSLYCVPKKRVFFCSYDTMSAGVCPVFLLVSLFSVGRLKACPESCASPAPSRQPSSFAVSTF